MIRNDTHRSIFLAGLVVLAAAVGAVAATGTVGAQDAGGDGTDGNGSAGNASDDGFYSPSEDELNARFRDCCANTVGSVSGGVLNLNLVYGSADEPYDVEISATNLSDEQIEEITFDNADDDTANLSRVDIVGMDFSDVAPGDYAFTVSVADADAESTVPLEVTGDGEATDETTANETGDNETTDNETTDNEATGNETTGNEATGNETELGTETPDNGTTNATEGAGGTAGNTSITAEPSAANTSANHTVSTMVGSNATGNLTQMTIDYGESNTTLGLVGGKIHSASLNGEDVVNNTTVPTLGVNDRNLTIGFDDTRTVSEGDRLNITYGGVTNPPESGSYTVGVAVNNGTFDDATFAVGENASAGNGTEMGTGNGTEMGAGNRTGTAATGNTSITAEPSAANTSANHTVSTMVGSNATGNLTQMTIDYGESNTTLGLVGGKIHSASLNSEDVVNNTTVPTLGVNDRNLTIGFDDTRTVSEGDRLNITYGGVTNPPESGSYTVGVAVNNGTFDDATLQVSENTSAGGTGTTTTGETTTGGQTTTGGAETEAGTAGGTAAGTAGAGGGTGTSGGEAQGTQEGGPGFTVIVAVVALLAAALLAARRD